MAFYRIVEIYTILVFHFAPYNRLIRRWGEDNHQLRAFMENVAGKRYFAVLSAAKWA